MRMIVEMKSFHLDCQYFAKVGEQLSKIIFGNDDSLYLHWKEKQDNFDSWIKNDGEKWSRKKYFKIPRWPSELLRPSAKKICLERQNWPGRLAGISEGHCRISK